MYCSQSHQHVLFYSRSGMSQREEKKNYAGYQPQFCSFSHDVFAVIIVRMRVIKARVGFETKWFQFQRCRCLFMVYGRKLVLPYRTVNEEFLPLDSKIISSRRLANQSTSMIISSSIKKSCYSVIVFLPVQLQDYSRF